MSDTAAKRRRTSPPPQEPGAPRLGGVTEPATTAEPDNATNGEANGAHPIQPDERPATDATTAGAEPAAPDLESVAGPVHRSDNGTKGGANEADADPLPEADESFIRRVTPFFKLLRLYSRLEVHGLERLPDGPAILAANHTGWLGLDYAYTAITILDAKKRQVRGLAHKTWFAKPEIASVAHRLGLVEVDKEAMARLVGAGYYALIFPEGERGAFKGERERYQLQSFARGYVRVALQRKVPIVPVAIVGGEEANPSSRLIDSYESLIDMTLPIPVNIFPRPVKWRISFLPPIYLTQGPEAANDREVVHQINDEIRTSIQNELGRLLSARGHPYI